MKNRLFLKKNTDTDMTKDAAVQQVKDKCAVEIWNKPKLQSKKLKNEYHARTMGECPVQVRF